MTDTSKDIFIGFAIGMTFALFLFVGFISFVNLPTQAPTESVCIDKQCPPRDYIPDYITGNINGSHSNGNSFYFNLEGDDGFTTLVSTTDSGLGSQIIHGMYYNFTLKRTLGAYRTFQIDQINPVDWNQTGVKP